MAVLRDRASSDDACAMARQKQLSPRMAAEQRDAMLPLGWVPGAEFRLANIDGGDHLFYMEPFEGLPHMPIPQRNIVWEVTAVHRITGIFITDDWTTVQFCPRPTDYPKSRVWVRVRHLQTWFAEIIKPGNLI